MFMRYVVISLISTVLLFAELSPQDEQLLDVAVIVKVKKNDNEMGQPPFGKNIDNSFRITREDGNLKVNNCFLNDFKNTYNTPAEELGAILIQENRTALFAMNTLYKNNGVALLGESVRELIELKLKTISKNVKLSMMCTIDTPTDMAWTSSHSADIVVVPKVLLPSLLKTNSYAGLEEMELLSIIPYKEIKKQSEAYVLELKSAQEKYAKLVQEYGLQAKVKDKNHVGSLLISTNDSGNKQQSVCTLSYKDNEAIGVLGYRLLNEQMLMKEHQGWFTEQGYGLQHSSKLFDKVFPDINAAYVEIQKDKNVCNFFVDYPENIVMLQSALQRDGVTTSVGVLKDFDSLYEGYVKYKGYDSKEQYQLALTLKTNLESVKALKKYGILNEEHFNENLKSMHNMQYSQEIDVASLLIFLKDKMDGEKKKISPMVQRKNRLDEEKKAAIKAEEDRKKEWNQYLKNYPYEGIVSCGFNGQHTTLAACFSGGNYGVDTEIEVTNGTQYGMYKAWQLQNLGREQSGVGMVIPLHSNFAIKAQNSNDTLVLTLVVKEKATGREIYRKSASKYGVVYFRK